MRKIIVGAQTSIDGVMQAPGNSWEDPTGGFQFGGWAMPYFDDVGGEEIMKVLRDRDLLLGRKTYEIFAAFWPYYDQKGADGEIAAMFDRATKYVVSGSGNVDTTWERTELMRNVEEIRRLRDGTGPDLVTQGSTDLVHTLFANDLVDTLSVFIAPVVLGNGKKLFADGSVPHNFKLVNTRPAKTGMIIAHYERDGAVKVGSSETSSPSAKELARRARMEREG